MHFKLEEKNLDDIVTTYQRDGVVVLIDVDPAPLNVLTSMLSKQSGLSPEQIEAAGRFGGGEIAPEVRRRLARGYMTPELRDSCLEVFGDLLVRLIGPLVHTSKTFHYQLKPRSQNDVILRGYHGDGREVEALYGIHNEFTAARVLTSPSAVVCWMPLNTFDGKALYFYPGSHRLGLLANRWLPRHELAEGIERVGEVVEYQPERGQALIFNFLLLHGSGSAFPTSSSGGPEPTRISCDLRFFPFCGILDSEVSCLRPHPIEWVRERVAGLTDDLLLAPLFETLAYLEEPVEWPPLPRYSVAHWSRFVEGLIKGDQGLRTRAIEALVNTEQGFDPVGVYQQRFAAAELRSRPYASIERQLPKAGELRVD